MKPAAMLPLSRWLARVFLEKVEGPFDLRKLDCTPKWFEGIGLLFFILLLVTYGAKNGSSGGEWRVDGTSFSPSI